MWKKFVEFLKSSGRSILDILLSVLLARIDSKTDSILAKSLMTMAAAISGFVGGLVYTEKRQREANEAAARRAKETEDAVKAMSPSAVSDELRRDFSEP